MMIITIKVNWFRLLSAVCVIAGLIEILTVVPIQTSVIRLYNNSNQFFFRLYVQNENNIDDINEYKISPKRFDNIDDYIYLRKDVDEIKKIFRQRIKT